ncbi:hypothetical protein [Thermoactinospora rubra]|uniref:hypothetical protein n=1 Tax=Thermoactinospora rubra TaxID=1088767 RepID=UPI000A0F825B|nr:hypothetical protein [Thermoactinospora rubra]
MAFEYQTELERQGEAKGRAKGMAKGMIKIILRVLERRGIEVPDEARERIQSCTDTTQLEQWFDRAFEATTIDDVIR